MNHQDGSSIRKTLKVLSSNVKQLHPRYEMKTTHNEIMLNFHEAEANGFKRVFWLPT